MRWRNPLEKDHRFCRINVGIHPSSPSVESSFKSNHSIYIFLNYASRFNKIPPEKIHKIPSIYIQFENIFFFFLIKFRLTKIYVIHFILLYTLKPCYVDYLKSKSIGFDFNIFGRACLFFFLYQKKSWYLRLSRSTTVPPMPSIEDKHVNSIPKLASFNWIKLQDPPNLFHHNIYKIYTSIKHYLDSIILQIFTKLWWSANTLLCPKYSIKSWHMASTHEKFFFFFPYILSTLLGNLKI